MKGINKIANVKVEDVIAISVFVVFIFFSWSGASQRITENLSAYVVAAIRLSSLMFIALFFKVKNRINITISRIFFSVSFILYYTISSVWIYKGGAPSSIGVIVCILVCFVNDEDRFKIFLIIKKYIVVMCILGIFCYLSYITIDILPYIRISNGASSLINYHISYLVVNPSSVVRLCGLFEEPGMLGTFLAFILCADNLKILNRENIILIISGILTFSLAFFIIIAIYYVLINLREPKKWIWIVVLAMFYLFVMPNIETRSRAINLVIKRLTFSDGKLIGDNRTSARFDTLYDETLHSSKKWIGYGKGYAEYYSTSDTEGLASIKSYIVNFGIIGTFAMYGPLIIGSLIQSSNIYMYMYLVINIISLYQRPYILQTPYFLMFICGLSFIKVNSEL